jgi:hypothetical protein
MKSAADGCAMRKTRGSIVATVNSSVPPKKGAKNRCRLDDPAALYFPILHAAGHMRWM